VIRFIYDVAYSYSVAHGYSVVLVVWIWYAIANMYDIQLIPYGLSVIDVFDCEVLYDSTRAIS